MKKILFICKYNRFRSKIAEAIFKKLNKNKKIKVKSAGIIKGSYLDKNQIEVAKKIGIKLKGQPIGVSTQLLKWQDTIVIAANDVPQEIFRDNKKYGKKLIVWKIPDVEDENKKEIAKIIMSIEKKVKSLIKNSK